MAETAAPERRTRSQLTLPDDILQIPERSPLKGARTALRVNAHSATPALPSGDESDDTDDELLLSPKKQEKPSSSSKRSASPPPLNGYASRSGSSEGRELKRAKRDLTPPKVNENEMEVDGSKAPNAFRQRLLSNHTRTHSDPNIATLQRSPSRKRSATTSKKPISTVSASPPRTSFSPAPTTPKKNRAHSVPLFPSNRDLPRIDFRNIPPSPKRPRSPSRPRSRSRSPSKEVELKQRIPSAMFMPSVSLPTIHDESANNMEVDQDTPPTPCAETASAEEVTEKATDLPTDALTTDIVPAVPTPSSPSISAIPSIVEAPATPAAQSLNKLIPLSPLTPLPETPLPPKKISYEGDEDRFAASSGWQLRPIEETTASSQSLVPPPATGMAASTLKSRLPRPSAGPSLVPSESRTMGPPPLPAKAKQSMPPIRNTLTSTVKDSAKPSAPGKTTVNAFDVLMQRQRGKERADQDKGKSKQRAIKPVAPDVFSSSSSGTKLSSLPVSSSQSKMKMKNKMKPKAKAKPEKPHAAAPVSDDESEEDISFDPWRTPKTENVTVPEPDTGAKPAVVASKAREIVEPSEPVSQSSTEDLMLKASASKAILEDVDNGRNDTESDVVMNDVIAEESILSGDSQAGREILPVPSENEVVPESPSTKPTLEAPSVGIASSEFSGDTQFTPVANIVPASARNEVVPETPPRISLNALPAAEEPLREENKQESKSTLDSTDLGPPAKVKASRLPLGKKRQPISVAPANRVTRSVSNKNLGKDSEAAVAGPSKATKTAPAKRKLPVAAIQPDPVPAPEPATTEVAQDGPAPDVPMDVTENTPQLPPGSPMKLSTSPAKTPKRKSSLKSPIKSPMKFSLGKPASSPSPTKIARSSTLSYSKPTSSYLNRTFSSDREVNVGASSSLSTLSNALEKLRMPAPSRPSTSMGFNRDTFGEDDEGPERSKDDTAVGRASLGFGQAKGLKRASTLGANAFKAPNSTMNAVASSSRAPSSSGKNLVQKPLAMFMSNKGGNVKTASGSLIRGNAKTSVLGHKPLFGVGIAASRRTISKKTTLPVVLGSPVKGGGSEETLKEGEDEEDVPTEAGDDGDVFKTTANDVPSALALEDLSAAGSGKGKTKEDSNIRLFGASRRVSMVSQALSQSLNMPPPPPPASTKGLMGPPPTPPSGRRNASSSDASSSGGGSPSAGTRSSARLAKAAEQMKAKVPTDGHAPAGKKEQAPLPNPAVEALKVLKDCVIFVDVRTDDGEEAGSLFVEMLEGVGARVLTRVGQTCTHIVYKNGLMSTVTRFRLLRDPKPLVVGIGWVVECVEQRKHVDEKDFLVDLEMTHVAGVNKRRRSMLPRLLASELSQPSIEPDSEADQSIDGSNSSMTLDDELAPLEKARRRKSLMVGLRA